MSQIAVIGAGLGGLCTALQLAAKGHEVSIFEKNKIPGGKLWNIRDGGYHFTYGPSTLTMPELYLRLLEDAGMSSDRLLYRKLDINHRNLFADGSILDASTDPFAMESQLATFHHRDAKSWRQYLESVHLISVLAREVFFRRSFSKPTDYLSAELLTAFSRVHPFQSMHDFHQRYFQDPRTLMALDRYSTYVGSDPRLTPATISMIGDLEYNDGVYRLEGGSIRLVEVLIDALHQLGVRIHLGTNVEQLVTDNKRIKGIEVDKERVDFDTVVFNGDRLTLGMLLPDKFNMPKTLSLSGFVLMLGVRKKFPQLHHHTLFYPKEYFREFDDIFKKGSLPMDPTIYICNTSHSDEADAPPHSSNLMILVNVPAKIRTTEEWQVYEEHILHVLETRCGLDQLRHHLEVSHRFTPNDLQTRIGSYAGAIYGKASHGLAAFSRPSLHSHQYKNLYFVGGGNHPGGGTPMVAIGAKLVSDLIIQEKI